MKEQLEKDLKKSKKITVLAALSVIFSVILIVVYYMMNDKTFIAFIGLLICEIYELQKQIKLSKKLKAELEK